MQRSLAIDFGTSNTAAAVIEGGAVRRLRLEEGAETLPTAVFFPADRGAMRIGAAAGAALISGEEGRYMRALKSVLGTALFHESRPVADRRRTLAEVVTAFLQSLKRRAEAELGHPLSHVLSGRPVHFHADPARDARAEADLRGCYHAAGFERVSFCLEPEAAALASPALATPAIDHPEALGLIVDIGGGTSDFSLFQTKAGRCQILASHGIRLGGTDFDRAVSVSHVMAHLGHGGQLRRDFGPGLLPMPAELFLDLATWAKIPFLYTRDTARNVQDLLRHATEPHKIARLQKVITDELGHDLAFAVEKGKIDANAGRPGAMIRMGKIERGLFAEITGASLDAALERHRAELRQALLRSFELAGVAPEAVTTAILVGGSSLMRLVSEETQALCPGAQIERGDAFTAVVDGLARASVTA